MRPSWLTLVIIVTVALVVGGTSRNSAPLPIVLWHGMGDTCCNPLSMGSIVRLLQRVIPGVNVTSLKIGSTITEDFESGFFRNVNDQIDYVCNQLKVDPTLQGGYNAIGFSQGGLFSRGLAERCPTPPMVNLISIGGPQQGVYGLPKCPGTKSICDMIRRLLDYGAYGWIQHFLVQAQYWQDPMNEDTYRNKSVFLADINCEKEKKPEYKENLLKLANFTLVLFTKDTIVQPKESEWFGFYKVGQATEVFQMSDSPLYKEDWIGLKQLNDTGRLHLLSVEADHLQIDEQWFIDSIINPFLKG